MGNSSHKVGGGGGGFQRQGTGGSSWHERVEDEKYSSMGAEREE